MVEDVRFNELEAKLNQITELQGIPGPTGPQGEQGPKGDTGDTGSVGVAAGFATPEVDASEINNVGTPEVSVTASGPNSNKLFRFTFKNLKGVAGAQARVFQTTGSSKEDTMSQDAITKNLDLKLDKVTEGSLNPKIYGVNENGEQVTYFATQTPTANTLPMRDASGRFQVADGVAPKQAVNKSQLDSAVNGFVKADEENRFTAPNTFTEAALFDKGLNSDGSISVTNSVFKVLNNSLNSDGTEKDYVAQYDADKITIEENTAEYVLEFPKKSGILATLSDVSGRSLDLKHSEIVNVDTTSSKEDAWKLTDDDASLSIYHKNTISQTGFTLSKNYAALQATETDDNTTSSALISFSSDSISLGVNNQAENKSSTITITKDGVEIDGAHVASVGDVAGKVDKFAESVANEVYARTTDGVDSGIPFSYAAEGDTIAKRSASGTLAVEDPTQEKDAANKKFVESKCASIPEGVEISQIAGSIEGVVADPDFEKLQSNPNNYILKDGKKFERSSERETLDSLSYVCNGYLNNRQFQEVIEITVSAKSWVLKSDQLLTDKTIANGKVGGVSIKNDFTDGLEISQTDGNLSIYGALDSDIAARNSKRPITTVNLNKAVLAALTDSSKILPSESQQSEFKAAWGFTASMLEGGIEIFDMTEISVNATSEATSGTIKDEYWSNITDDKIICLKLNNEYYYTSDDGHTPGVKSFTHTGWNGNANQTKSINVTLETKAWTLTVGYSKYYRHYIKLTLADNNILYYDFPSTQGTEYTLTTLPDQPDDSHSQFTLVSSGYYSSVNGQLYRDGVGTLKAIVNGIYTNNGTSFQYISLTGTEVKTVADTVKDV